MLEWLLDEWLLLTLLLLLLLLRLLSNPRLEMAEECRSMESDLDGHQLVLKRPLSELTEGLSGRIWPWKKTSSAAHMSVSAALERRLPPTDIRNSKSSTASSEDLLSLSLALWMATGKSESERASSSSSKVTHFS